MSFELKRDQNIYNNNNNIYNGNMLTNIHKNNFNNYHEKMKNNDFNGNVKNYNNMNYNANMNNNYKKSINYMVNKKNNNNGNMNNNNSVNYYRNINRNYKNKKYNNKNYNMNSNQKSKYNMDYNENKQNINNSINIYKNNNDYNNDLIDTMISKENKKKEQTENYGGVNIINIYNNNSFYNETIFFCQDTINSINNHENKKNNLNKNQNQISSSFNVRVAQTKNNQIDGPLKHLNCLLKFLLLKKISNTIENISNLGNFKDVEEILKLFQNKNKEEKISKNEKNILDYLKYLDNKDLDLNSLIDNLFKKKQEVKNEIINYWKYLSKYEEYNNDFEHKLFEDLKNCHLDYSIENMNIMERDNPEEYEQKKKECKNMKKMILYFLSEIYPDFNKTNIKLDYLINQFMVEDFIFLIQLIIL